MERPGERCGPGCSGTASGPVQLELQRGMRERGQASDRPGPWETWGILGILSKGALYFLKVYLLI